jgi:putative hemolysin
MMNALAALLSISPALFEILVFFGVIGAQCYIYAVESAWLGLSRPWVHRALEHRPADLGAQLWLLAPGQLWLALYLTRSLLWFCLGVLAVLRWIPFASAYLGMRGPLLWGVVFVGVGAITLAARVWGQAHGRKNLRRLGLQGMGLLAPLGYLLGPVGALLERLPQDDAGTAGEGPFWTAESLVHTVRHAHQEHLGDRGLDLFASLSEFSDTVIREIMVPRTEVVSLAATATHDDICAQVLEAGHSRMPVYEETIDHIIGILHVKDLFAAQLREHKTHKPFTLQALLRPCFYVPEMMQISLLLREFQRRKTHLAIVVDEYGGTAGVVTLEDIIEEIVGEIQDEYDVEEKQFRILSEGKILADARVSLWDLEQALNVSFPADGEYETLAGFLMAITGYLPQRGAQVTWENLRFTIKDGNERRIGMVDIERLTRSIAKKS